MIVDGITGIIVFLFAGIVLLGVIYSASQNTHRITRESLRKLSDSFDIIEKVKVTDERKKTSVIDYVVISKKGIYLLKVVNRKGIITGDESQPKWSEDLISRTEEFDNPIVDIVSIIKGMRNELDDAASNIPMYPIVVFHKRAVLSNLFSDSLVVRADEIVAHLRDDEDAISSEQLEEVKDKLIIRSQGRTTAA